MRKYWTEKEIDYLKKWYNIKPINEISKALNRTYPSIQGKAQRLNLISPDKKKINRKSWNKDEEKFLEKYYFKKDAFFIANKLNRSLESVRRKAQKMGLNAYIGDKVHVKTIAHCFNCDSRVINRWISKFKLPFKKITKNTRTFKVIDIETFWKWAEKNKEIIPWQKYIMYSLLPQPDWVKDTVCIYKNTNENFRKPITNYEKTIVYRMTKQGYSVKEIAEHLNRTIDSVKYINRLLKEAKYETTKNRRNN